MRRLEFTNKEKKSIRQAIDNILDDIDELLDICQVSIRFLSSVKDQDIKYIFVISPHGITFAILSDSQEFMYDEIDLEVFNKYHKKRPEIFDYNVVYYFIKEYDKIREKIIEKIHQEQYSNAILKNVEKQTRQYDKEAIVELVLPPTNNQHIIELSQEGKRKVGIVKLGDKILKLITDNEIYIENREEVKIKEKKLAK